MTQNYGFSTQDFTDLVFLGDHPRITKPAILLSGQNLKAGTVLGKITWSIPTTGTADAGNTGNGTVTGVVGGEKTKEGIYTLTCTAAAADGGTFQVEDPDGNILPDASVGSAYSEDQIGFTINDGATDFVVSDKFTIEVAAGSGKVKIVDFSAVDGSQNAVAILLEDIDASAGDEKCVVVVHAEAVDSGLTWPDGITAAQKNAAIASLQAAGIYVK